MKVYSHSEQGKRDYQQDRYLVKDNLFVVCDGMGGHSNGELAAEAGINRLDSVEFFDGCQPMALMNRAIEKADKDCKESGDDRGSTVTAVHVDEKNKYLSVAHVGDSRAYLIKGDNTIRLLTTDHCVPWGGLTSCLGFLDQIDNPHEKYEEGDRLLIVSDGVSGAYYKQSYTMVKEIERAESEGWDNPAEHLCWDAISRGSTDNCTAILVVL